MEQTNKNYILDPDDTTPKRLTFGTSENIFQRPEQAPIELNMPSSVNAQQQPTIGNISYKDFAREMYDVGESISKAEAYGGDEKRSKYDDKINYHMAKMFGTETLKGGLQNNWEKWGNATVKFGLTTATTAADVIVGDIFGLGQGIYQAAFDRDGKSAADAFADGFMNNEFSKLMFDIKNWGNEKFTNYYSGVDLFKKEKGSFWDSLTTANFWADDVFVNMGYMAGIGLGLALMKGMSVRGLSMLGNFGKSVDVVDTAAKNMLKAGKAKSLREAHSHILRGVTNQATDLSAEVLKAAKDVKTLNYFTNPAVSLAAASSEARMESLDLAEQLNQETDMFLNSEAGDYMMTAKAYNEYMQANGIDDEASRDAQLFKMQYNSLSDAMKEQIEARAFQLKDEYKKGALESNLKAQLGVYMGNLPILLASNAVMFGKGLIRSTGKYGSGFSKLNRVLGITAKDSGKFAGAIKGSLKDGVKLKWFAKKTPQIIGRGIEKGGSEMMEELSQQWISDINNLRYKDSMNDFSMDFTGYKYAPEVRDLGVNIFSQLANAMGRTFKDTFTNKETWLQGFTGAFTGLFGIRPNINNVVKKINKKENVSFFEMIDGGLIDAFKEGDEYANEARNIVDKLNPLIEKIDGDFTGYLGAHYMMEAEKQAAQEAGNTGEVKDLTLKQVVNDMMLFQEAGLHDEFIDRVQAAAKLTNQMKAAPEQYVQEVDDVVHSIRDSLKDNVKDVSREELFNDYADSMEYVANAMNKFLKIKSSIETLVGNYRNKDFVNELTFKHFMAEEWTEQNNTLTEDTNFKNHVIDTLKKMKVDNVPLIDRISEDLGLTVSENVNANDFSKIIDYLIIGKNTDNVNEELITKLREERINKEAERTQQQKEINPDKLKQDIAKKLPLFFEVLASAEDLDTVNKLQEYISNLSKIANYRAELSSKSLMSSMTIEQFNLALMDIDEAIDNAADAHNNAELNVKHGSATNATNSSLNNLDPEGTDRYKIFKMANVRRMQLATSISLNAYGEEQLATNKAEYQRLGIYMTVWNIINSFRNEYIENKKNIGTPTDVYALAAMRLIDARLKNNVVMSESVEGWFSYFSEATTQEELDKLLPNSKNITANDVNSILEHESVVTQVSTRLENYTNSNSQVKTETTDELSLDEAIGNKNTLTKGKEDVKSTLSIKPRSVQRKEAKEKEAKLAAEKLKKEQKSTKKEEEKKEEKKEAQRSDGTVLTDASDVINYNVIHPYLTLKVGNVFKRQFGGSPEGKNSHFSIIYTELDGKHAEFVLIPDNIENYIADIDVISSEVMEYKGTPSTNFIIRQNGILKKTDEGWEVIRPVQVEFENQPATDDVQSAASTTTSTTATDIKLQPIAVTSTKSTPVKNANTVNTAQQQIDNVRKLDTLITKQGGVHVVNNAAVVSNADAKRKVINKSIKSSNYEGMNSKITPTFSKEQADAVNRTNEYLKSKGAYTRLNEGKIKPGMEVYIGFNREIANASTKENGKPIYYMAAYVKIDGEFKLLNVFSPTDIRDTLPGITNFFAPFVDSIKLNSNTDLYNGYDEVVIDSPVGVVEDFAYQSNTPFKLNVDNGNYNKILYKDADNTDDSLEQVQDFDIDNTDSYTILFANSTNIDSPVTHAFGKVMENIPTDILSSAGKIKNNGKLIFVVFDKATKQYNFRYLTAHTMSSLPDGAKKAGAIKEMIAETIRDEVSAYMNNTDYPIKEVNTKDKKTGKPSTKRIKQPIYLNFGADSSLAHILYLRYAKEDLSSYNSNAWYFIRMRKDRDGKMTLFIDSREDGFSKSIYVGDGLGVNSSDAELPLNTMEEVSVGKSTVSVEEVDAVVENIVNALLADDMNIKFHITENTTLEEFKAMSNLGLITTDINTVKNPYTKTVINISNQQDKVVSLDQKEVVDNIQKQSTSTKSVNQKIMKNTMPEPRTSTPAVSVSPATNNALPATSESNTEPTELQEKENATSTPTTEEKPKMSVEEQVAFSMENNSMIKKLLKLNKATADEMKGVLTELYSSDEFKNAGNKKSQIEIMKLQQTFLKCK